jgi:signal peptidase I
MLPDTPPNVYGEALNKQYIGPVLLWTIIERGDFGMQDFEDQSTDIIRTVKFRFFKDHLITANVVPEVGDIVMYNEIYYEVNNVNENQKIVGKDPNYSYSQGLDQFGSSFSVIIDAHYTSPDKLNIQQQRT